jgi:hypothetical protein
MSSFELRPLSLGELLDRAFLLPEEFLAYCRHHADPGGTPSSHAILLAAKSRSRAAVECAPSANTSRYLQLCH